jgi:hypothetical protein
MLYPEEKIREAILHPDHKVQRAALSYFSNHFSSDPTIMPVVIQALEMPNSGLKTASLRRQTMNLRQTPETVDWLLRELNAPTTPDQNHYHYACSQMLIQADIDLVAPRQAEIAAAENLHPRSLAEFNIRLRVQDWDQTTCWESLERFCDDNREAYYDDMDWSYARVITERLADFGHSSETKIHEHLSKTAGPDGDRDPLMWLQPCVVSLAGQIRLGSAIPRLLELMYADLDNEVLDEKLGESLGRIGGSDVLQGIRQRYPEMEFRPRLTTTIVLGHIHSEECVDVCAELHASEEDGDVQQFLVQALLDNYPLGRVDYLKSLFQVRDRVDFHDPMLVVFLRNCTMTGERFPEYEKWLEIIRENQRLQQERQKELWKSLSSPAPGSRAERAPPDRTVTKTTNVMGSQPFTIYNPANRVGRNDQCSCGSGKKFKKCCGKNS